MKVKEIINKLKEKYPGKKIIKNKEEKPTEIICEVEPASQHPQYSLAVAVVDKIAPHVHHRSTETYRIIRGELQLFIDSKKHQLKKGEQITIQPNQVHWGEGREVWLECYSKPGWTPKDHILRKVH